LILFLVLPGGLLKGLGLSPVCFYELFPYVSEVLSEVLGEGGFSYGFGGFDFSYDEVKRVGRRLIYRFFSVHS